MVSLKGLLFFCLIIYSPFFVAAAECVLLSVGMVGSSVVFVRLVRTRRVHVRVQMREYLQICTDIYICLYLRMRIKCASVFFLFVCVFG